MTPDAPGDDDPEEPSSFRPSRVWLEAFDAQCTDGLVKRARRYAVDRTRLLGSADTFYAEELVQNAITDTLRGILSWVPGTRSLRRHIFNAIRLRARRDRDRADRFPHVSFDALHDEYDDDTVTAVRPRDPALHTAPPDLVALEDAATLDQLRERVANDPAALRFLAAIDQEAVTKAEILRRSGLSSASFHNTRRRLARLVRGELPAHLKPGNRRRERS
jgi:hypothetical protein